MVGVMKGVMGNWGVIGRFMKGVHKQGLLPAGAVVGADGPSILCDLNYKLA